MSIVNIYCVFSKRFGTKVYFSLSNQIKKILSSDLYLEIFFFNLPEMGFLIDDVLFSHRGDVNSQDNKVYCIGVVRIFYKANDEQEKQRYMG